MSADFLSTQTLQALGFVGGMLGAAIVLTKVSLPKHSNLKTNLIFVWLTFDSICHLVLEGSFLYFSTQGRTVNKSKHFLAYLWQDYAVADTRWGVADPTVVSLELLTVLGEGPLAGLCAYLIAKNNSSYHFWVIILSIGELYGGFMTFCPEWLTQNKNLNGSNFLLMWVYLVFMNMIWVVVPIYLIGDSYAHIIRSLKTCGARPLDGWRSGKKTKSK